ncbi:MAG TPA: threonine/serine dehydratase [Actinomycetota bacterium]|jgi:threonine dehydratase|nr:threonine/serine dehydratase [Actinomycetota bacterium]
MNVLAPGMEPPSITRFDVETAAERVLGRVRKTPVQDLGPFALGGIPGELVLKLELLQYTGSFKPRGAFNRMLSGDVDSSGVLAASGGNFGLAVAFAARQLGHRAEIFVPDTSPEVKIARIRQYGAEVHVIPGFYADAAAACEERAMQTGALFMHPYDQPEVVAGQGTIGLELSEQTPAIDTVLVAVGGGGLIAGIAAWFANDARVVGVEPERCPTLTAAFAAGRPVDVEVGGVAADALGARRLGDIAFEISQRFVERVVMVPDDAIVEARRRLWDEVHLVTEPGAAAPVAALLMEAYVPEPDERVVVVVCGANTDPADLTS